MRDATTHKTRWTFTFSLEVLPDADPRLIASMLEVAARELTNDFSTLSFVDSLEVDWSASIIEETEDSLLLGGYGGLASLVKALGEIPGTHSWSKVLTMLSDLKTAAPLVFPQSGNSGGSEANRSSSVQTEMFGPTSTSSEGTSALSQKYEG